MKTFLKILILCLLSVAGYSQTVTSPVAIVKTISKLKTQVFATSIVYVTDSSKFYVTCSPCVVDEITIFAGASGKKWKAMSGGNGSSAVKDTISISVKWFGAKGDGTTDDAAAIQSAINFIKDNPSNLYAVDFPGGRYKINTTIQLPRAISTATEAPRILFRGWGATLFTTSAIAIMERVPTSQADADGMVSNWVPHFEGLNFQGSSTTGQVGLRIGATLGMAISKCTFQQLDTAIVEMFCLKSSINNTRYTLNKTDNIVLTYGARWGGTPYNSASNVCHVMDTRVFGADGANSHFSMLAANGVIVKNFISEGFKPRYNFILDGDASTVVTACNVENVYFEANGGTYANNTNFRIRAGGIFKVTDLYLQFPDTLFNSTGSAGGSKIIFDGLNYTGGLPSGVAFNAGGQQTLGYHIIFRNINNGPTVASKLYTAASWSGGVLPIEVYINTEGESGSGTSEEYSGGDKNIRPGQSVSLKKVNIHAGLYMGADNTFPFGGVDGISNNRPSNVFVGSKIVLDNAGRFYFGNATTTPDVGFSRSGAGQISIINNNFADWRDLKLRNIVGTGTITFPVSPLSGMVDSALWRDPSSGLFSMKKINLTTIDTTSLSNRINLKVNTSDTAAALAPYLRKVDTASLSTRIDAKVTANGAITGSTKTKITYDSKGLVTAGADAAVADISGLQDSLNAKARLNGGNTLTGDQTFNSQIYFPAAEASAEAADSVFTRDSATGKLLHVKNTVATIDNAIDGNQQPISSNAVFDLAALKVEGPASATDNAIARFDNTTGKLVQNSSATISDAGTVTATFKIAGATGNRPLETDADGDIVEAAEAEQIDYGYEEIKALRAFGSTLKYRVFGATAQSSTSSLALADGTNRLLAVHITRADTITGVAFTVLTAGDFTADNENRVGLYSVNTSTGGLTLVASSANDATGSLWKSTGTIKVAFSTPYIAAAGAYVIGLIYNNSAQVTAPSLLGPSETANRPFTLDQSNSIRMWATKTSSTLESSFLFSATATTNRLYLAWLY